MLVLDNKPVRLLSDLRTHHDDGYFVKRKHRHADTAWEDLVRDDFSTFHVAAYDPDTGELVDQGGILRGATCT